MKATNSASGMPPKRRSKFRRFLPVYLMALPGVIYLFINNYMPLPGLVLAFKNYSARKGIFGSDWAGHFPISNICLPQMMQFYYYKKYDFI